MAGPVLALFGAAFTVICVTHEIGLTSACRCLHGGSCSSNNATCACPVGWTGTLCQSDVNECNVLGQCGQVCSNTAGSYVCSCLSGYTLESDGWACKAGPPSPYMLFARGKNISAANLDLTGRRTVVSGLGNSTACDFLFVDGVGYFADSAKKYIGQFKLDGSTLTKPTVIIKNIGHVEGLAVNWVNRSLIWSDVTQRHIYTATLDGREQTTLVSTGLVKPRALVLEPFRGHMYWTDWDPSRPRIERASLEDGSQRLVVIDTGLLQPNGLTIDYIDQRMFWADSGTDRVESSNLDGTHRTTVANTRTDVHPYSLALFTDQLFYTDVLTGNIKRIQKYNGLGKTTLGLQAKPLNDIHIVHPYRQMSAVGDDNECAVQNGKCQQVCINTIGSYRCTCVGGFVLDSNNSTCSFTYSCGIDNGGCSHTCNIVDSQPHCSCPAGFQLDVDSKTCIDINECNSGSNPCSHTCINTVGSFRCSGCPADTFLDSTGRKCEGCPIKNGGCQQGCVTSHFHQSFYCFCHTNYTLLDDGKRCQNTGIRPFLIFTNGNSILKLNFDGSGFLTTHPNSYLQFTACDVDLKTNTVYLAALDSRAGATPFIGYTQLAAGSVVRHLVPTNVGFVENLEVDYLYRKLFWIDSSFNVIKRSDLNGANVVTIVSLSAIVSGGKPYGLVLDPFDNSMYFSIVGGSQPSIFKSSLDGGNRQALISSQLSWPYGLDIDFVDNRLIWSDGSRQKVESINLNGTGRQTLQSFRACLLNKTGCAQMCVPSASGSSYTCTCRNGWVLDANQRTCTEVRPVNPLTTIPLICPPMVCLGSFQGISSTPTFRVPSTSDSNLNSVENPIIYNGQVVFGCREIPGNIWYGDLSSCYKYSIPGSILYASNSHIRAQNILNQTAWMTVENKTVQMYIQCNTTLRFCVKFKLSPPDPCLANASGCSHNCTNHAGVAECSCPVGLELSSDNATCQSFNIDPCLRNINGCSHNCTNHAGVAECSCPVGQELSSDNMTCQIPVTDSRTKASSSTKHTTPSSTQSPTYRVTTNLSTHTSGLTASSSYSGSSNDSSTQIIIGIAAGSSLIINLIIIISLVLARLRYRQHKRYNERTSVAENGSPLSTPAHPNLPDGNTTNRRMKGFQHMFFNWKTIVPRDPVIPNPLFDAAQAPSNNSYLPENHIYEEIARSVESSVTGKKNLSHDTATPQVDTVKTKENTYIPIIG